MSDSLFAFPTTCAQALRALARYPSRVAFSWPGGSLTYAGATELIGRIQRVFMQLGLEPGTRVAFLTANRADSWCAGIAAQLSRLAITWLHPLGSLDDQLFQIEDSEAQVLVIDADAFRDRGGDLATRTANLKAIFTLGAAGYGIDLLAGIVALESVRRLQAGLQSFLSMRRIDARRKNAKAFRLRHSQSLAKRRQRLSHAMVRSTIQRLGKTTKPLT